MRHRAGSALAALVVGMSVLAASCPSRRAEDEGVTYFACTGGGRFAVAFDEDGDVATIELDGEPRLLAHVPSASGARFSDGRITLFTKGRAALVEVDGVTVRRDCTVVPPPAR